MITRLNKSCTYFPCHDKLGDCTFCYCPFYPCGDERAGRYVITKDKHKVWSCKDCNWIHDKKVVDKIFNMIRSSNLSSCVIRMRYPDNAAGQGKVMKTGVIILGHGSKLEKANDSLRQLAKEVRIENGLDIVEPAFLQLCQPDLKKAIKKVVKMGCKRIIIVPFFLFMGNHVARDIPNAIKQEAKIYREVKFIYAKNLGQNSRINNIVMDCIREVAG